jgi:hypothetical protein
LCLLIGLGGFAWILAVVEGLIAAVAATTGLHLGVWIRDQLRHQRVRGAAPDRGVVAAPNTGHHTMVGPRRRRSATDHPSTARAASAPLRTRRRPPAARPLARAEARREPSAPARTSDCEHREHRERDDTGHGSPPHNEHDRHRELDSRQARTAHAEPVTQ